MRFWNPLTLQFVDPAAEKEYTLECLAARITLEGVGHAAGIVFSLAPMEGNTGNLKVFHLLLCWVLAPFAVFLCARYPAKYLRWRVVMNATAVWGIVVHMILREAGLPSPEPGIRPILSRLGKGPIFPVMFSFLGFPSRFRFQILFSMSFLGGFYFWTKFLCDSCHGKHSAFDGSIEALNSLNLNLASTLSLTAAGIFQPREGCLSVLMVVQIWLGLLLPSFFLYNSEVSSRARFLARNATHADKARIFEYMKDCQGCCVWVLMFAVAATCILA
ncbi:hypothetical protein BSKO_11569 [Bryopsis sp. KO-2023]|nr:hypothetical protein BSKO_11569 [Bryopsis sp. KO-2023]